MLTTPQVLQTIGGKLWDLHKKEVLNDGSHPIRGTLALTFDGAVQKAPDTEAAPPAPTIPLAVVLALLGERYKIKTGDLYEVVMEAVIAAYADQKPVAEYLDLSTKALNDAKEKVAATLEKKPKKGAVTHILTLSDIQVEGTGLQLHQEPQNKKRKSA